MDLDWCLYCGRRVDTTAPYCSSECYAFDHPTDHKELIYPKNIHPSHWVPRDSAGILAWASNIPSGHPAGAPYHHHSPSSLKALRPPKLLLPHQRPIPPTLCMSTPLPARPHPSLPIVTPQQHIASLSLSHSTDVASISRTSLLSCVTNSSFTTPSPAKPPDHCSKPTVFGALATQVRSWVTPSAPPPAPTSPPPPPKHTPPQSASSSPAVPQFKPKRQESATFTVLAKTHCSLALHILSSSQSSVDETSDDDVSENWWVSSASPEDSARRAESQPGRKKQEEPVRGRRVTLVPLGVGDDHPAFWSRGRKLSRAVA